MISLARMTIAVISATHCACIPHHRRMKLSPIVLSTFINARRGVYQSTGLGGTRRFRYRPDVLLLGMVVLLIFRDGLDEFFA